MDYLSFFNLNEDPFRLTPDPHFFYPSQEHNDVLFSLDYVIEQKEGFSLIVGEPGTGKTTILRVFIDKWKDKAEIALIMTPRLTPEEFLQAVLEDLNVHIGTSNKNEMIKAFRDILIERSLSDQRVIIVVDEAQNLPYETLEELRLLSNLETEKEKLLQIMLVGQPELKKKLLSENLKQLNQRIAVKATLNPLNNVETQDYINFRLRKAGKGSVVFEDDAIKLIYKLSKGIPRLINLLSSRSLMAAYIEGTNFIKMNHVEYAKQHLSYGDTEEKKKVKFLRYALISSIMVIIIFIVFGVIHVNSLLTWKHKMPVKEAMPAKETVTPEILQKAPIKKPEKTIITVVADANLRESPSVNAGRVSGIPKGTLLEATEEHTLESGEKWYKVKIQDGNNGWISERAIAKSTGVVK
ncbi:MAG: AAA family ATPase [Proteobacteria bacterium]|nr:AAA family ATPase [Pseudomonadota bacterium]